MNMSDISKEELQQIILNQGIKPETKTGMSDEELIAVTKATINGDLTRIPTMNKNAVGSSDSNYWEVTGLPSKGRLYSTGVKIMARPLKVLEVKKLSSINESNGDYIINEIVKQTVKGINPDEIYIADKLYIIFWLRANTYRDSGYVVKFVCKKCEKESEFHFQINDLDVKFLHDDYDPSKELVLKNGDKIRYKYLTISDETYIDRFKEINSGMIGEVDNELLSMAQMITDVNNQSKTLIEKYHYVINMNPEDFAYLSTIIEERGMGIKPYMNVKCDACGGTTPVGMSFQADFFIPKYKTK